MTWALVVAGVAAIFVVLKVASSWERFQADWDDALPEARQTYPTVLSEAEKYEGRLERRFHPDYAVYDGTVSSGVSDEPWPLVEVTTFKDPERVFITPGPASEAQLRDMARFEVGPGLPEGSRGQGAEDAQE